MTSIDFSIAARFADGTVEAKLTRTGIATPTLEPLFGDTEEIEGSVTVPVDWLGVVVGAAGVLGFAAAAIGPPVVADAVVGADAVVLVVADAVVGAVVGVEAVVGAEAVADADAVVGAADDVVVVTEDAAVEVSTADEVGPGAAALLTAVLAHPVSSINDPATAAPASLFPTAVPPLKRPTTVFSPLTTPGPRLWLLRRSEFSRGDGRGSLDVATA
ncbi:hypothetical protein GCM10009839_23680 [Catenulispora yoronensis]|uniref:Uncharacterized protein n=1 Tax=Catenulispora yoronensis TaxID=450799 RepID=A0ABP5FEC8_9ACTN